MDRELNKMEEFPKFPQPQEQYIKIDGQDSNSIFLF